MLISRSRWPARRRCLPNIIACNVFILGFRWSISSAPASEGASALDDPAAQIPSITLEAALARAESASPLVRRARSAREVVAARQVGAGVLFPSNPVLAISAGRRREESPSTPLIRGDAFAAHLEQSIELGGQRATRQEQVTRELEEASWREKVAISEVRARTRIGYVSALLAEGQVRATLRRSTLVDQLVESIRARVEAGASSSVDLQLALIEKGRAARERLSAELSVDRAETELRVLLNVDSGMPLVLVTPLERLASLGSDLARMRLEVLVARARAQRAELKALSASRDALDAELVRLRREAIPSPTIFLDFQRDLPGQHYLGGGFAAALPVWRYNQGEQAIARAERERTMDEHAITEREIGGEVERAFRAVKTHAEIVRTSETLVLPAAESAVDLITRGWQAGKFDLFRVIQASREASDARRSHLESLGALLEASIALERAVGVP